MKNKKHPTNSAIKEALRYIDNAKDCLKKSGTKTHAGITFYSDKKYVRMAGHTAWSAILLILEPLVGYIRKKKKNKKGEDVPIVYKDYENILRKKYPDLYISIHDIYRNLHVRMGYDGELPVTDISNTLKNSASFIYSAGNTKPKPQSATLAGAKKAKKVPAKKPAFKSSFSKRKSK